MGTWAKRQDEVLLVGRDWTIDLDGAAIASSLAPEIPAGSELELNYIETEGNVTKYWLRGGLKGQLCRVAIAIITTEGESLSDSVIVSIKAV